jgi:hypothetical protein
MKLWTVYLIRKSGRGRVEYDTLEAVTPEDAIRIAEANNPGYQAYGAPKREETNE